MIFCEHPGFLSLHLAIEGWGITTIEANACGTPVIASDVSGLRDSVRDGETGLLVPYGDTGALAEKIILVLVDGTLRKILSRYAIVWSQNFEWSKSSQKFIEAISVRIYIPPRNFFGKSDIKYDYYKANKHFLATYL